MLASECLRLRSHSCPTRRASTPTPRSVPTHDVRGRHTRSRAGAYIRKEMLQERWKRQKDTRLNGQHEEAPAGRT